MTNYCPNCGTKNTNNYTFCMKCGTKLTNSQPPPPPCNQLTDEQLRRQIQLEAIWMHEKTVPKMLRGTWQARLSFSKLEKGLTESEKEYLKRRRDTE
jgi:uncharacterized membrane protein YvbJ